MVSLLKIKFKSYSDFNRQIIVLLTGTGVAQAIPILISPVLTRIYTPHEFGVFGIYMASVSVLSVFSTGRYDLSIIEPKQDRVAKVLMLLSLYLSLSFSLMVLLLISLFHKYFVELLGEPDIAGWLFFLPVSVFAFSCYSVFSHWLNRTKMYKAMSVNRVIMSSSVSSLSVLIGVTKVLTGGLIFGYIIGQIVTIFFLKQKILKKDYRIQLRRKYILMKEFIHYPKYLIPATLASELSGALPLLLVTNYFSSTVTGFFSFASRVSAIPISLIGNAIGEVYRQKASEEYALYGNCKLLYLQTLKKLIMVGIVPFLVLLLGAEHLFQFAFGDKWIESGRISKYLSFLIFFQFISTPLAYTISFNKSQKHDMFLQFLRLFGSIAAIIIGYKYNSHILSIILYSIIYSIYYISHSLIQYRAACGKKIFK